MSTSPTHRRTVDVTQFGADPSGRRDSAPAVAQALAEVAPGNARLRFPHGRYAFGPEGSTQRELYVSNTVGADPEHRMKRIGVMIEGLRDVVVDGEGSTLVFHGTQTTVAILDSADITVRDVEIDFARPTVIDALVTGAGVEDGHPYRDLTVPDVTAFRVDGRSVIWEGECGPTGAPLWEGAGALDYCQRFDPRTGRTVRVRDPVFRHVSAVRAEGRRIRITYSTATVPDDVGAVYQYRRTTRDHPGIAAIDSTQVRFERVTVRFLHGFGLVAQNGQDLELDHCVFQPPPGTGRRTAGFADFLQCSGMSGRIVVRDCMFDGAHDDPINIHGTYLALARVEHGDVLVLDYAHRESAGFPQFAVGDEVELVPARTLVPKWPPFRVVEVDGPSGRDHTRPLRRMRVRVDRRVPSRMGRRFVAENITRTPDVEITDCVFRSTPTRGILVTTRGRVRIAGNVFERMPMPCIFISADARRWFESGPVRDVVIEGNRFVEPGDAVLAVEPSVRRPDSATPVHGRIELRDNTVVTTASEVTLIRARSVGELIVSGNVLPSGVHCRVAVRAVATLRVDQAEPPPALPEP